MACMLHAAWHGPYVHGPSVPSVCHNACGVHPQEASGVALPNGRKLVDVAVEKSEEGALRPLPFDERQHVVLCEELKHLYTAITRAKNNGAPPAVVHGVLPRASWPGFLIHERIC